MGKNRTSTDGGEMRIPLSCLTAEPSSCTISGTVVRLAITSVSLVVEAEEEETVEDSLRLLDTWGKKQHYKLQCGNMLICLFKSHVSSCRPYNQFTLDARHARSYCSPSATSTASDAG